MGAVCFLPLPAALQNQTDPAASDLQDIQIRLATELKQAEVIVLADLSDRRRVVAAALKRSDCNFRPRSGYGRCIIVALLVDMGRMDCASNNGGISLG